MAKSVKSAVAAVVVSPAVVEMSMADAFGPVVETAAMKSARETAEMESAFGPMIATATSVSTGPTRKSVVGGVEYVTPADGSGVTAIQKAMLVTSATYHQIVEECFHFFPNCKTNTKCVATVAKHMKAQYKLGKGPFVANR